jgi:large subunit ribosomal protein L29
VGFPWESPKKPCELQPTNYPLKQNLSPNKKHGIMSLPKIQQIHSFEEEQLEKEILASKKDLFELRLKQSTKQFFTPHSFRHLKHRLGQLLMIQSQKQREKTPITKRKKRG